MVHETVTINVLRDISAGVLITDADLNVVWLNSFEEKFYKSTFEKMVGTNVIDCHKDKNKEKIIEFLDKFKSGELTEFTKTVTKMVITYSSYYKDGEFAGVIRVRVKLP